MNRICESGRSMVEMIGVIAIIGVISAGGLAGYSRAMYRFQLSKVVSQIADALKDYALFLKRGVENYPTIETAAQVRQYGLMNFCEPDDNDSKACKMPLGKLYPKFTTSDRTDALIYKYTLTVSFEKNHKNACIDFLVYDWNRMVPDRWWHHGSEIKVTSNQNTMGQIAYSSTSNRLNAAGATDICNTVCAVGTSTCNVVFEFVGKRY